MASDPAIRLIQTKRLTKDLALFPYQFEERRFVVRFQKLDPHAKNAKWDDELLVIFAGSFPDLQPSGKTLFIQNAVA